jgi:nicotinamidase-related amidase
VVGVIVEKNHLPRKILEMVTSFSDRQIQSKETGELGDHRTIALKTRRFKAAVDENKFDTELSSSYVFSKQVINLNEAALVLIDVWETHPNDGWLERAKKHMKQKLLPLLQLARDNRMLIIHAPHGKKIAKEMKPLSNEVVLDAELSGRVRFKKYLENNGIKTLLYAGYVSNWCVLHRPIGIIGMRLAGYNVILIRDCTIAFETPETLSGEWANKVTINMIEIYWGATTTLDELDRALSRDIIGSA